MEPITCAHCAKVFTPRNRSQSYCSDPECQRARKAAWQRIKFKTDPEYRAEKKRSQQKWLANHPGYWKDYRKRHPEKALRNRILQTLRNRKRYRSAMAETDPIAKIDASNPLEFKPIGQFLLVPLIAKMDATKVNMYTIPESFR